MCDVFMVETWILYGGGGGGKVFFTCSFKSVTLSLGFEGELFGAHKLYAMTIGYRVRVSWSAFPA